MKCINAEPLLKEINHIEEEARKVRVSGNDKEAIGADGKIKLCLKLKSLIDSLQQEQQEVDLKKFTEKMDAWKARYNYPDNTSIKGTMAFTARMFYMYPEVAREWYDSLPKVTLD